MVFEYKVIPAPKKGRKARGIKGAEERFSFAVQELMNEQASEGWEFLRSETLPSEERQGLTSTQTVFRSVLVFRRPRADDVSDFAPELLEDLSDAAKAPGAEQEAADDSPRADAPRELDGVAETDWADADADPQGGASPEDAPEADRTRA